MGFSNLKIAFQVRVHKRHCPIWQARRHKRLPRGMNHCGEQPGLPRKGSHKKGQLIQGRARSTVQLQGHDKSLPKSYLIDPGSSKHTKWKSYPDLGGFVATEGTGYLGPFWCQFPRQLCMMQLPSKKKKERINEKGGEDSIENIKGSLHQNLDWLVERLPMES